MKLTTCKDCGQAVSKEARRCPHCGAKLKSLGGGCCSLILLLILGLFFSWAFRDVLRPKAAPSKDSQTPAVTAAPTTPEPFDILTLSQADLPQTTILKAEQKFQLAGGSGSITVPSGSEVRILKLVGTHLEVGFLDSTASIPYTATTIERDVMKGREKSEGFVVNNLGVPSDVETTATNEH